MRDSISIIFAAMIGIFLIVILPLYSILDRQDSMSYNVALTATTNFVDNVRNNGFIDKESYNKYMAALASTANTYKVNLEVYKRVLIKDADENGNILDDSYVEEKELYNTQDILQAIEATNIDGVEQSNIKNSAYLLSENDEIYVRIHNTNITTGSMLYGLLSNKTNSEVINISYGGVVNNVNWELYDKINTEVIKGPEVLMSVPVNAIGQTNIQLRDNEEENMLDCSNTDGNYELKKLCDDLLLASKGYVYLYDLAELENKTIKIAVELKNFDKIDIGTEYIDIDKLEENWDAAKQHILSNYIMTEGFIANKDIKLLEAGNYYDFEITFTDIRMTNKEFISSLGKIMIKSGLGIDDLGTESTIAKSVDIELTDTDTVNTVAISKPMLWNKLLKTKRLPSAIISDNVVYANTDIAFLISYTGIKNLPGETDEARDTRIKREISGVIDGEKIGDPKLITYGPSRTDIECFTSVEADAYKIDIGTVSAGQVLVKFKYTHANTAKGNHIELPNGWIETNIEDSYEIEDPDYQKETSVGASSPLYEVLLDLEDPNPPSIGLEGTLGNNGWYRTNVKVNLLKSTTDMVRINGIRQAGGSGVDKNTLEIRGANILEAQEVEEAIELTENGRSYARGKAYDYAGNYSQTDEIEIKIDKEAPTAPIIELDSAPADNDWYTKAVTMTITPGTDNVSGVEKTTYEIVGANALAEQLGTTHTLEVDGESTIIARTYDVAGNVAETSLEVKIDKSIPPQAKITVIEGEKNHPANDWYNSTVKLKIEISADEAVSGLAGADYKIQKSGKTISGSISNSTKQKEVEIKENGEYTITVYTSTRAGRRSETPYTLKIDMDAPNIPTVSLNGEKGENDWYIEIPEITVTSNGDVGPSDVMMMTYTLTPNGQEESNIRKEIVSGGKIPISNDGKYTLNIYTIDKALNEIKSEPIELKIDRIAPTPAEFVITGTEGKDGWYISDVNIAHQGAQDNTSGIQSVTLSHESITENTNGTIVTLTTKDNAGYSVTKEVTIKLDTVLPAAPEITFDKDPEETGGPFGVLTYNENVTVSVQPVEDDLISGIDKNTLEVTADSGNIVLLEETEGETTYTITHEGLITITARVYDKAGNITETSKVVWINKEKPEEPRLIHINGTDITGQVIYDYVGNSNECELTIDKLVKGNIVTVVLTNKDTGSQIVENRTVESESGIENIKISLDTKGTYSIKVTQTNIYGTESNQNEGLYSYIYE